MGRWETGNGKGKLLTAKEASKELRPGNESRARVVICNPGTTDAWLAFGITAGLEEGIYLKKEGGSWSESDWHGPISVIGSANITFAEY